MHACTPTYTQGRDLYNLGRYIGMSIIQGGSGLPCLADPVYDYFCTGKSTDVKIANKDIPENVLSFVVNKVSHQFSIVMYCYSYA